MAIRKIPDNILQEIQRSTATEFASKAEEKRFAKASESWNLMHAFLSKKVHINNPLSYAKMTRLELARADGPRPTILKRLIGKYFRTNQVLVQEQVLAKVERDQKAATKAKASNGKSKPKRA